MRKNKKSQAPDVASEPVGVSMADFGIIDPPKKSAEATPVKNRPGSVESWQLGIKPLRNALQLSYLGKVIGLSDTAQSALAEVISNETADIIKRGLTIPSDMATQSVLIRADRVPDTDSPAGSAPYTVALRKFSKHLRECPDATLRDVLSSELAEAMIASMRAK